MGDRLSEIFRIQIEFSKTWLKNEKNIDIFDMSRNDRIKWSKEYILSAVNELCEALNELKWKTHREFEKQDNIDNFNEECIDVFKFLLNLLLINGIKEDDFYQKFIDKSEIVQLRYEQEKAMTLLKLDPNARIAIVDIDGCLNNYPYHFLEFTEAATGLDYKTVPDFKEADIINYNKAKASYRLSGGERGNVPNEETFKFLHDLKAHGYTVVLLSSRPYEKIKRLYSDTVHWLNSYKFPYDYLVFNKNKDTYIIDNLKDCNVEFCVDDDFNNAQNLSYHFPTYLMVNKGLYSLEAYLHAPKKVKVIDSLLKIELTGMK